MFKCLFITLCIITTELRIPILKSIILLYIGGGMNDDQQSIKSR
jgi:hypothetical protein